MGKFLKKYRKAIIGTLIILIYLTLLTLLSFSRSMEIKTIGENLANYTDFLAAGPEEGTAWINESGMHVHDSGTDAKVFSTAISLRDLQKIQVRFNVECPEGFAGTTLHVDLYADGYDTDEQEFTVSLRAGKNEVTGIIDKGSIAPEEAQLRIFCLDAVECDISDLSVQALVESPHGGKLACVIIAVLLVTILVAIILSGYLKQNRRPRCLNKEGNKIQKKDIGVALTLASFLFVLLYFFLGFAEAGISTPWAYSGDDFIEYTTVKGIIDNGWIGHNNYLGMPYGADIYDMSNQLLMGTENFLSKVISLWLSDPIAIVNIRYLLTVAFCSISAYFVLRELKIKRYLAIFGASLFALAPYILARGISHLCLSACYFVPFSVLLCVWSFQDNDSYLNLDWSFIRNKRNVAAVLFAFLIANNGAGYYQFFTCFLLCVVGLYKLVLQKKVAALKKPLITIGLILIFFVIALMPNLFFQVKHGYNLDKFQRAIIDGELYGLKIAQLFIPINGHGIDLVETFINKYNTNMPLVNENSTAYLGICGIIGFLISLLVFFMPNTNNANRNIDLLHLFSKLNISAVLLCTVGGFASLLSLAVQILRSYNRISIFILFVSICTLCSSLQMLVSHLHKRRGLAQFAYLLILTLFIVGIFDQLPTYGANDAVLATNKETYASDERFVNEIENLLQPDDMIFQLPYHPFPEAGPVNQMSDYHLLTGYLHSSNLKWSYGGMKGREADRWNEYVSSLPMQELIDTIVTKGFRGVYIDTRGYTEERLSQIQGEIESIICEQPIYSDNGTLLFYNLYPYLMDHVDVLSEQPLDTPPVGTQYFHYEDMAFMGDYDLTRNTSGIILYPGAMQYGPYITLKQGTYVITISGENLDACTYDMVTELGEHAIVTTEVIHEDNEIQYTLSLPVDTDLVEFRLKNESVQSAQFNYLKIELME